MDLEALSKNITIDTTASQEIAELCNKLLDIEGSNNVRRPAEKEKGRRVETF